MPAVRAIELTRAFDARVALDGLSLEAEAGEVIALLGPNGAGKSTAVRLLNGVLRPDRGRSEVLGLDPAVDGDRVRRRTGVVTEHAGLDERLSARQNLAATAAIRGLRGASAFRRIDDLLERFGAAEGADRPLRGASTGERKRVALVRALLHDPDVLFLDEPTSGLDPGTARGVVDLVAERAREQGCTVVLCTHVLHEAAAVAGRVGVLRRGRLQAFGTPEQLAAGLWRGVAAVVDLGAPAPAQVLEAVRSCPGVLEADASADGAQLRLTAREALAPVVATLVGLQVPVYGAAQRRPTLEDVYFALQADRDPVPAPGRAGAGAAVPT